MINKLIVQVNSQKLAEVLHAVAYGLTSFPGYSLEDFAVNIDRHDTVVSYNIASIDNEPVKRSVEVLIPNIAAGRSREVFLAQVAELVRWSTKNDGPSKAEDLADMFLAAHTRHNIYACGIGTVIGCNDCEVEYEVSRCTGRLLPIGDLEEPAISSPMDYRVNWGIPQGVYTRITQFSSDPHSHWRWTVLDPYERRITSGQTPDEKVDNLQALQDEIDTAVWWAVYMGVSF